MEKNKKAKGVINVLLFLVGVAFLTVVILRKDIFQADSFLFNVYEDAMAEVTVARIFKTVVVFIVAFVINTLSKWINMLGVKSTDNKSKTVILLLSSALKYASFIAVLFVALTAWGIDTTAIATGAGVITLIVGLGCQSMISDIVAGIFILFEGDIQVGDVVVINGWRGTVLQIGLRRTKIEDLNGNVNIINNSSISNIINNTRDLSFATCIVGIEYNESIERVEAVLAENFPKIREKLPKIVEGPFYKGVQTLNASSVDIKINCRCHEDDKFQLERDLNREIKLIFDQNNINIPFPQVVLNYRDENEQAIEATKKEKKESEKFIEYQKEVSKNYDDIDQ